MPAFTCVATLHPAKAIEAVTARTRAILGLEQLRKLPEMLALRREIASR